MTHMSWPNSAAVKDIDIDIADILSQKYRYRIDIGKGNIDPALLIHYHFNVFLLCLNLSK